MIKNTLWNEHPVALAWKIFISQAAIFSSYVKPWLRINFEKYVNYIEILPILYAHKIAIIHSQKNCKFLVVNPCLLWLFVTDKIILFE